MNLRRRLPILQAALWLSASLFAGTVNYKYDDAGRLTSASYADGSVIAYSYDNAGNLLARTVTAPAQSSSAKPQRANSKAAQTQKTKPSPKADARAETEAK